MANWLPSTKPSWWSTIRELGRDPRGFIIGFVATWIVGGILNVGRTLVGATLNALRPVTTLWQDLATLVTGGFRPAADALLWVAGLPADVILGVTDPLGPYQVFVLVPAYVVAVVLVYKVVVTLLNVVTPRLSALLGVQK